MITVELSQETTQEDIGEWIADMGWGFDAAPSTGVPRDVETGCFFKGCFSKQWEFHTENEALAALVRLYL